MLSRYVNGTRYECRRQPEGSRDGIFYIFWSEQRRSKRATTRTRDVAAAQAFLDEWCAMIDTDRGQRTGYTCADLWKAKYGSGVERVAAAWKHLAPVFGALKPVQVTSEKEARYVEDRRAEGAAASTIRVELSLLRSVWNHAVKKRVLQHAETPVLGPLPEASPPRERWLTDDEIARVLSACEHPGENRVRMFVWLALETGARRTAIEQLTWGQVDWHIGVIHYLPPGARQTRKRKASVPISAALRPVLEEAFARRGGDPFVIGSGTRINKAVDRIAARAGVAGLTPHVFRHTAATIMVRNGVPLWVVAKILGNTLEQVEKVYAKWVPQMHVDAVNLISGRKAA